MKTFRIDVQLNHDTVSNFSPTEECVGVKEVIHTNGGHLQIIFENNSEVVYNASSWRNYVKTVKA
jgi:phosphotransferase system IIB component